MRPAEPQKIGPHSNRSRKTRTVSSLMSGQSDVENRIAIGLRIVGDGRRHGAALDEKFQWLLREIGQPGDAGLAIAIGADFDLRLALAPESVLDCKAHLGVKNSFACPS